MSASLATADPALLAEIFGDVSAPSIDDNGTVHVDANGTEITIRTDAPEDEATDFDDNLALDIDQAELARIASELIREVQQDDAQRQEWLNTRAKGIAMLGLAIEEPRGDIGATEAPLEGMSSYRSPVLLNAVLRAQATARGEMLPASGPVKIYDDSAEPSAERDDIAEVLENDLNIYLTQVCKEYYPDTDKLLFWVAFGGAGFKKGYHCPIRRRPVLESVDARDIIVSPGATTLSSALRVTHKISVKHSDVLKLMASGHFRQTVLAPPTLDRDPVKIKEGEVMGLDNQPQLPSDQPRTLYEVNCERVIDDPWRPEGLPDDVPLPYRITVDKDGMTVLAVHRRWEPDDPMAVGTLDIVRYCYVEGMDVYGIGLVQILGNTTRALTAAQREMLDAGMFANFPGFIYDEAIARQLSNEFRVPPGGGVKVQVPAGKPLSSYIMPMPYKDVSSNLLALTQHLEQTADKTGGTAELPTGEGASRMPVGTVLALIDQASKPLDAVHKRLHAAQAEEFQLLKRLLRQDPGALWRFGHKLRRQWDEQAFLEALSKYDLVPVADPNVPTHTHRLLKAMSLKQLSQMSPGDYNQRAVDQHILHLLGFSNPQQFFNNAPPQAAPPAPPAPQVVAAQLRLQETQIKAQADREKAGLDALKTQAELQADADIAREREQAESTRAAAELAESRHKTGTDLLKTAVQGMAADNRQPLGGANAPLQN